MPKLLAKADPLLAALRKTASTLKAALVVSAAAILSQAAGDRAANQSAATGHFDDVAQQLHALRRGMLPAAMLSAGYVQTTHIEIDAAALDAAMAGADARLVAARQALDAAVDSTEADGIETFTDHVGALGRAFHDLTVLIAPAAQNTPPFAFDQFFLASLQDLSMRDWSPSAADEA